MKKLGFGCMRLPMVGDEVDLEQFKAMVDRYLAAGFRYFDTAHGYISGKSEIALRQALVERYPREDYIFTNKLSGSFYQCAEDVRPLFEQQLEICGLTYFDYYLMHAMSAKNFAKAQACNAFETVKALKAEGKIRHIGMSFHDSPQVLEEILTAWPEIEVVQIQFNYLDYDDPTVQSFGCYQVCRKFGKPVLIMEPVKGGKLAELPDGAKTLLDGLGSGSPASYAIRYAASFEGVLMVLSGMSDLAQMEDNLSYMADFVPLNQSEFDALARVREILRCQDAIPCTNCRYCVDGCPRGILIPDHFAAYNAQKQGKEAPLPGGGDPAGCVGCCQCEQICPQHLPITHLLRQLGGKK